MTNKRIHLDDPLSEVKPSFILPCNGGAHLTDCQKGTLEQIAVSLGTPGKGITACDESAGTMGARFEKVGVENTIENRRLYREMLLNQNELHQYVSGAILDPETLTQHIEIGGQPILFGHALELQGIVCGVKPHLKVYILPGTGGDTVMQGLDSLAERLRGYYILGARFTKWRAPFTIDAETGRPTAIAIEANMRDLARVALISQAEGMVPIVEPDVVMQGTHDLPTAVAINTQIHATLYKAMLDHGVYMEGCILKTNMVTPGLSYPVSYTKQDIAAACLTVLKRTMPVSIRSCNYLSGGQALHVACARLGAIQALKGNCPWNISFSWSAALQLPLLDLCKGTTLQDALPSMASLYLEELQLACAASKGIIPADFEESIGGHEPKN